MKKGTKSYKKDKTNFFEFLPDIKLSDRQNEMMIEINKNTITFVTGFAGTSKTFSICYTALNAILNDEQTKINKIIFTKPIESSGSDLGFLPGTLDEKTQYHEESFYSNIKKMIDIEHFRMLKAGEYFQFKPITFMRGATYDNTFMFLDEGQNMTAEDIMLYVSRLGKNSKIVIAGDISQHDIAKHKVGLDKFYNIIKDVEGVGSFKFGKEDIVRNKILVDITDRYDKWKYENERPKKVDSPYTNDN